MKRVITQAFIAGSIVLLPTLALARGIEMESHGSVQLENESSSLHIETDTRGGSRGGGRDHAEDDFLVASGTASSTHKGGYWSNPDNAEDVRGRGGDADHRNSTSTATTSHRGEGSGHRGDRGNKLQSFLAWILGQPGSTTVQDLRTQIEASSTIKAEDSHGLGFLARLFGFFKRD